MLEKITALKNAIKKYEAAAEVLESIGAGQMLFHPAYDALRNRGNDKNFRIFVRRTRCKDI